MLESWFVVNFCSAKMWFIRQRQMVLVFLILRSYDEDDDNEEESEKSSSSSKTSGLVGFGSVQYSSFVRPAFWERTVVVEEVL